MEGSRPAGRIEEKGRGGRGGGEGRYDFLFFY